MSDDYDGYMYMWSWFGCIFIYNIILGNTVFIAKEWKTGINECSKFFLGCCLTFFYCVFHIWISNGKNYLI